MSAIYQKFAIIWIQVKELAPITTCQLVSEVNWRPISAKQAAACHMQ
jgi:hypothetical protein